MIKKVHELLSNRKNLQFIFRIISYGVISFLFFIYFPYFSLHLKQVSWLALTLTLIKTGYFF